MRGANGRSRYLARLADAVLHPGFEGTIPPAWLLRRLEAGLGGVALFGRNIESWEQVTALTGALREANPQVTIAVDEEAGDVTRLEARTGSTRPGAYALGTVDDTALTAAVAEDLGRALRAAGITLNYAPDADVNCDPDNPVIGVRAFGAEPDLVARHTEAWIRGQQHAGVASCVKHFPGHGNTRTDSHLAVPVIPAARAELDARELVPFRRAIAAGVRAVMTGHLLVPAIDAALPATLSRGVLTGLLRDELGFTGVVITDGIEMLARTSPYGLSGATVRALAAGADVICVGGDHADEETATLLRDAIVAAVADGELSEHRLFEAAGRAAELARWTAAQPQASGPSGPSGPDGTGTIGFSAARRALRVAAVRDDTLPLRTPPYVVELAGDVNIAVGDSVPAGLGPVLTDLLPGTTGILLRRTDVEDGTGWLRAAVAAATARPLIVVVRDAHRYPWMSAALRALVASREDCIVVEMGISGAASGAVYLSTHGSSLACRRAAAEVLVGRSPVPVA